MAPKSNHRYTSFRDSPMFKKFLQWLHPDPLPDATHQEVIQFEDRDDWYRMSEGFPRPDWDSIHEYLRIHHPGKEHAEAHRQAIRHWLGRIQAAFRSDGIATAVIESKNSIILGKATGNSLRQLLKTTDTVKHRIWETLGDVAWNMPSQRLILIDFPSQDSYYHYVSHFYDDGEHAGSGGMAIHDGQSHIALPNPTARSFDVATPTIAHETAHIALSHLSIPNWLNEAIAMHFETLIGGHGMDPARELQQTSRLQRYWTPDTIQQFWSGEAFFSAYDQDSEMAYDLARVLFNLLHTKIRPDPVDFRNFVRTANRSDAGEDAAMCNFGISLGDLAAIFLGPGDWEPRGWS